MGVDTVPSGVWGLVRWPAPLSYSIQQHSWGRSIVSQSQPAPEDHSSSSPLSHTPRSEHSSHQNIRNILRTNMTILNDQYKSWEAVFNRCGFFTSLMGHCCDRRSCSSFWSSLRVPRDCCMRRKSDSSFRPASVKYFEKCSTFCLLAGKSSWSQSRLHN